MLEVAAIRTKRLEVRPFSEADLAAAYAFNADPDARRFMGGVLSRADSDSPPRKLGWRRSYAPNAEFRGF